MKCNHWSQNCHGGYPEVWKRCAERHGGVECDQLIFEWHHYPDSPFGDVYICNHGVCVMMESEDSCRWCGHPRSSASTANKCNYHSEINGGLCLKSGNLCDSPFSECGFAKEGEKNEAG